MLIKAMAILLCHSRGSGNPVIPSGSGLPPEFIPAKAGAGVTAWWGFTAICKHAKDARCMMIEASRGFLFFLNVFFLRNTQKSLGQFYLPL